MVIAEEKSCNVPADFRCQLARWSSGSLISLDFACDPMFLNFVGGNWRRMRLCQAARVVIRLPNIYCIQHSSITRRGWQIWTSMKRIHCCCIET